MKLSIAMTTYNPDSTIIEQLESLARQTRPADEVIIVDDGSQAQALQTVKTCLDAHDLPHWQLVESKENQGYIEAFRKALSLCSGDWIFLCDQDDVWYPEKIQTMEAYFALPSLQALFSSFSLIDAQSAPLPDQSHPGTLNQGLIRRQRTRPEGLIEPIELQDLLIYNTCQGCTMAVSRPLAAQYLALEGLRHLPHDYALNLIAASHHGLYYLDTPLVLYRIHDHNTLGLLRQKDWNKRTANALLQARMKTEARQLVETCGSPQQSEAFVQMERFFARRAQALKNKSLLSLAGLAASVWKWPPLEKTVLYDMALCAKAKGAQ